MPQKINVRPSRPALVMGLIAAIAFLVFGIVFLVVLVREEAGPGIAFMVFWIFIILLMIGYFIHLLRSRKSVIEIETETALPKEGPRGHFAGRLRELESLKREGLVTEDEFQAKRAEIMREKW